MAIRVNEGLDQESLIDRYGRTIKYLRLSVTDRCDFRCTYCMSEDMQFLKRNQVLSFEQCLQLARVFVSLGVEKIRVTGGEPLVRKDLSVLLKEISALQGVRELVLTTNGSLLAKYATELKAAGVTRLNVSFDSLNPERFRRITRTGSLENVLSGISAARKAGFIRTKLNVVMMKGVNDDEICDLVKYAVDHDLDISFIEEMPLGDVNGRQDRYISSAEVREQLSQKFSLIQSVESSGGPAKYWRIAGVASKVGFISPHSHNFCDTCNRVRVTAKGELYPCLGQNDVVNLMPMLSGNVEDDYAIKDVLIRSMDMKPFGHEFSSQSENSKVIRFMSMTGG